MKLTVKCLLLSLLITAATAASLTQDEAAVKKYIQGGMDEYSAMFKKKDAAGVERVIRKYFASSYFEVDPKGNKTTVQDVIDHTKMNIGMTKSVESFSVTVKSVKLSGNTATTSESMRGVLVIVSPMDPKKTAKLGIDSTWTTTYTKTGNKWMATQGKILTQKMTLNGKPWDPTK